MSDPSCRSRHTPSHGHGVSRADAQEAIRDAVAILGARHQVRESSAFTILVQASVDSRQNVRDTACGIVEEARRTA